MFRIKESLGIICGGFFGFLTSTDPELELTSTVQKAILEDFERSLLYFIREGAVIRYGDYCIKYGCEPGDDDAVLTIQAGGEYARGQSALAAARRLVAAFPDHCFLNLKWSLKSPLRGHPITLRHLQPKPKSAPSCLCGSCCFCAQRDRHLSIDSAIGALPFPAWCRWCRVRARTECSRLKCHGGRCWGSHCVCSGRCSCSMQTNCPHKVHKTSSKNENKLESG
jgi:hypothetical protein